MRRLLIIAGLLAAAAAPARAQEFCVVCTEPAATYRCQIENAGPGAAQSMQVACITEIAKQSGHAQCSVKRNVTVFECDAPVRKVSLAITGGPEVAPATKAEPLVLPRDAANEPPRTVVEAAQRANDASKKQVEAAGTKLREAGAATGDFFKRTFRCVGTLFTDCR
jgi:hypothetical protein